MNKVGRYMYRRSDSGSQSRYQHELKVSDQLKIVKCIMTDIL